MKYFTVVIILGLFVLTSHSQNTCESYRAIYSYRYTTDSINGYTVDDIIHLELEGNRSFCYSKYTWQLDSLTSSPQGEKIFEELLTAALLKEGAKSLSFPHRKSTFLITKNIQTQELLVKDNLDGDYYLYKDSISDFKWNISTESKTIGPYSVIKAVCAYHGREWIVWFSPELPWHDGPWKFCGLPGLIVEAYDNNNMYYFILNKLLCWNKPIEDWVDTYSTTERVIFNKNKYNFYKNNRSWLYDESDNSINNTKDTRYLYGLEPDFIH